MKKSKRIEALVQEVCCLLAGLKDDDCRACEAEKACVFIVNAACGSLYDGLGILEESKLSFREIFRENAEKAGEEVICEDCKGKLEAQDSQQN